MTTLTKDILQGFENKENTLAVFCDLSKAFDTLDHDILINKLQIYGIRGPMLNLLQSYLHSRSMYVKNGKEISSTQEIPDFGVPQGSVLGPILFNIYVNDIQQPIMHSKYILYADDTTIYIQAKDMQLLFDYMNKDLKTLSDWFKANKLALNVKKTKYMLFNCRKGKLMCSQLSIDGINIEPSETFKFLGIHLDKELKWDVHCRNVEKKVAAGLYALNAVKHIMATHQLNAIYYALIHPYLNYGCSLWGNTHKKYIKKIKMSQNKAVRIICHAKYNTPAAPLFHMRKILKFEDLYKQQICQFMYKMYKEVLPVPLLNIMRRYHDVHYYNTRHSHDYIIPKYKCNIVHQSFLSTGPKLWMTIPNECKTLNYKAFCRYIKKQFLSHYIVQK